MAPGRRAPRPSGLHLTGPAPPAGDRLPEGAAPYAAAAFPPDSGALGDSLRDGLRMAAPGLDVCEWWDWVPPGVCLYVDLPVPPSRGVEEALTLHVLVSALCPYCCVFCQRSLSVPSAARGPRKRPSRPARPTKTPKSQELSSGSRDEHLIIAIYG